MSTKKAVNVAKRICQEHKDSNRGTLLVGCTITFGLSLRASPPKGLKIDSPVMVIVTGRLSWLRILKATSSSISSEDTDGIGGMLIAISVMGIEALRLHDVAAYILEDPFGRSSNRGKQPYGSKTEQGGLPRMYGRRLITEISISLGKNKDSPDRSRGHTEEQQKSLLDKEVPKNIARSAVANKQSLKDFLTEENIDVALISETWFKPNKEYIFRGYRVIRNDRYDGITGTAILVKQKFQFTEVNLSDNTAESDISACCIKLIISSNKYINLASVYRAPHVKKSTLLNKISTLATLDLVNSYWTHKTSPPLCEAFRETPSLRVRLSRLYDDDPTHSFFDFTAQATVIIPTYTDNTIANRCILQNLLNNYTEYIQVYTDGSKNESGTGCAFLIPKKTVSATYRLPDVSSIFSAEAYAIMKALDVASDENNKIIILSDSLSVIKLLQQSFPPSVILNPYLARIKSKVYDLRRCHKEVVIIWTKAHTGIQYNEAVDALAKSAALNQNVETDAVCLGDCISFTKKLLRTSWSEYYQDYCRNRPTQYTAVQDHIPVYPWYSTVKMPRKLISMYSRLRFGHGCYPSLLARFGIVNDPLCDECQIESTLNHIFFECHKYRAQQNQMQRKLIQNSYFLPYTKMKVIIFSPRKQYEEVSGKIKIKINGITLQAVSEAKNLGVTIDSKLRYKTHACKSVKIELMKHSLFDEGQPQHNRRRRTANDLRVVQAKFEQMNYSASAAQCRYFTVDAGCITPELRINDRLKAKWGGIVENNSKTVRLGIHLIKQH
nr:unnamed protein product [Callosobruchus chinensis]